MPLLKADNLKLGYGSVPVAENITFSVNKGDYLCVIGENGSGKTTLIKALTGLVKPLSGNIEFGVGGLKIGYLPQQTELQRDFPASVKEIVMSGFAGNGIFHPFYSKKEKETARRFAERLGISKLWQQCYRELSGGQQQRVLLARALCASGDLLLLDEPAAALDTEAANEMYELISSVNRDGTAVIMVTHDIKSALKYSNLILKIGNEIFFGTNEEFLQAISEGKESE
ncbi:MAG TPA: ABC transporter [Ruminococcaceae bacterium]|nr:ABC transporter [Oscillospiraceae bacterium]